MSLAVQVSGQRNAAAIMEPPAPIPPLDHGSFAGPMAPVPGAAASPGLPSRVRDQSVAQAERVYGVWTHLSLFATLLVLPPAGCVVPIILWLIRREKSPFVDDHGRELANVVITGAIATAVLGFIPIVGWIPLGIWYVATAVSVVRGAVAAHRGEFFRYPMVLRFLS